MNGAAGAACTIGAKLLKLAFFCMLPFLLSCGGGGGGVDVTPPSTNLPFVLGPPRGPANPLTITGSVTKFTLPSDPPRRELPEIQGTFDTATLDTTISDNAAPILFADTATPPDQPLFGNLEVAVSQPFRWNGASDPTAGEFLIRSRDGFFPGTIRARVLPGGAGVQTKYDSNNDGILELDVPKEWVFFHDLWADGANPLPQRVASFVFLTREGIFSMMELSMETINIIEDLRTALQTAGSDNAVGVACDALPGTPNQPGSFSIVWTDVNGNGVIDFDTSPAQLNDTFTFTINQCWTDDPSDPDDLLLDGVIRLTYYEPHLQWGTEFQNLVVTPTQENVAVPEAAMTVNGGFSLLLPGF